VIEAVFAVPGDLAAPTGGYAYARRMLELLPAQDVAVRHLALPSSFPDPSAADLAETARRLYTAPLGAVLLIDGLACGVLPPPLLSRIACPIVALVHHPLGFEVGLSAQRRAALLASERAALAMIRRVITTSSAYRLSASLSRSRAPSPHRGQQGTAHPSGSSQWELSRPARATPCWSRRSPA
jgi:hypothetical protein